MPPKWPGQRRCTASKRRVVSTPPPARITARALTLDLPFGTCDHDVFDHTPVRAEVEIDDGAVQTERDAFGTLDPFAVNQREPRFGRPPLQHGDGNIGTKAAQMPRR